MMLRTLLAALLLASTATATAAAVTLRIGLSADITSLDPQFLATQPNLTAARHMFESLVDVDERTHLIPGLATSWHAIDPLTWEFRLRHGVKFHDGSPLTVADVIFSLQRPLSIQSSPGGFAAYVRSIASLQAVGDDTLRVTTRTPYGALPEDINSILILSKRAAEHATPADFDAGRALIGTGPYRFVRYARGDRLELMRHDQYWDKPPPWEHVVLRTMTTDPIRTAALLSGEVDVIEHVPSADYARLAARSELHLEQTVSWRTIFLTLDQYRDRPPGISIRASSAPAVNPFRDRRVRLALSKAIDRDALARIVLEGLAMPAANIVSPGVFGHDPALRSEPVDRDAARRLLAEAGYADGLELTIAGPNNRYINDEQVLQAVAQMLAHVGIRVRVEAAPLNVFLTRVRREQTSFALLGWGSFAADLAMRSLIATPDRTRGYGAWNWGRYSNGELDRLITQSLATVDRAQREAVAREAGRVVTQEVALIPLYHQRVTWAMRKGLAYRARTDEFTLAQYFAKVREE